MDEFILPAGEFVVLTRLYQKRGLAECLWQGLIGLFSLNDLQLVQNSKAEQDPNKHILVHTTPQKRPLNAIGSGSCASANSRNDNQSYDRRTNSGMRVLQPSDMNRGFDEETKVREFSGNRSNSHRDESRGMFFTPTDRPVNTIKRDLRSNENYPQSSGSIRLEATNGGSKRRLSIFSDSDPKPFS